MEKIVVDTSFVVNILNKSELKHNVCNEFFIKNNYEFIAPELILIESASYFVRILNFVIEQISEITERIRSTITICNNYSNVEKVVNVICKYKARGADSIFVQLAEKYHCQLITCDKDQAKKYPKSILI